MSHSFQVPDDLYTEIATYAAQRGQSPDVLLMDLVKDGVEQLKQTDSMAALRKIPYDPAHDPLAPFIGAFDIGIPVRLVSRSTPYELRAPSHV